MLFEELGGYYDTNTIEIVKYDFNNDMILATFDIPDTYITPTSIVHDGKNIWVSFSDNKNTHQIFKINQENGQIENTVNVQQNVIDMTYDNQYIYLCSYWNSVLKFDPQTENFVEEFRFGPNEINSSGILTIDSLLWIAFNQGNLIGVFDIKGLQVGYARVNEFEDWNELPKLSMAEDKLLIIENGVAKLMTISRQ